MKYYKKYTQCFFVKGYKRGVIYDINRKKYDIIPNTLIDFVDIIDEKPINYIEVLKKKYEKKIVDEYIRFLIDKEYIFTCNKSEMNSFTDLNLDFKTPSIFTNAVFQLKELDLYNWRKIKIQLDKVNCKHIQIISKIQYSIKHLEYFLNFFIDSRLKSIEIYIPINDNLKKTDWKRFFNKYKKIKALFLYNSNSFYNSVFGKYGMGNIIYLPSDIQMNHINTNIHPNYFNVNIDLFIESQKYNTYFNKKLFIDTEGNVVNNFEENFKFGKIDTLNLLNLSENKNYTKYWNIDKSKINTCSVCEFRHMCVDNRIPIHKNNEWHFETTCNYNPKTLKWKNF